MSEANYIPVPGSQAVIVYDDRAARRLPSRGPGGTRKFHWGLDTVIINGEIKVSHEGVSNTLRMIGDQGGPGRVQWHDEKRYANQGWTCVGCPHFGLSETNEMYCAHPLYLELYQCPQYHGRSRHYFEADRECPMLARRAAAAQRRYRWHHKSSEIFWRYYHDSGLSPYRHGFSFVYPMHRLGPVNAERSGGTSAAVTG